MIPQILLLTMVAIANSELKALSSFKSQYIPISNRYPGIEIRGAQEAVVVELVYDVTCNIALIQVQIASTSM